MAARPYCLIFQEERNSAIADLGVAMELIERCTAALKRKGVELPKAPAGFHEVLRRWDTQRTGALLGHGAALAIQKAEQSEA